MPETSGDRVFQTRAAAIGKPRSPIVDRFDVGTSNVSDYTMTVVAVSTAGP